LNALITLLVNPEKALEYDLQLWDMVIRHARASGLLGALYHTLQVSQSLDEVLPQPKRHLISAATVSDRHAESVCWEIDDIYKTLDSAGIPVMALKGAAYALQQLEASRGRYFGDVDIMVPRGALPDAEKALKQTGWLSMHHNDYDDQYYRRWMHEIPPLIHSNRHTVLDVHHNILPLTANLKPQAEKLWDNAVRMNGYDDLYHLAEPDLILHSATHLFQGSEFDRGLRDLFDIARLVGQFRERNCFWQALYERADELDLVPPLAYALRYIEKILSVDVPVQPTFQAHVKYPSKYMLKWMDKLFLKALQPHHLLGRSEQLANYALYLRGHYLRMPPKLLVPHLFYKATMAKLVSDTEQPAETVNPLQEFLKQGND
jgi:putative nucleotidyltransferase-like protein